GQGGRRGTCAAGVAQADGDITALGPAAGQVGSNRRYGSGAGCAPGAESSGGPAGRQKPRAQALGRPPGRPGWRANSNSKPPPLASSRAEPGLQIAGGGLTRRVVLKEVGGRLQGHQGVVSEIAGDLVERLAELTMSVNRLQRRIEVLAGELTPSLVSLPGCAGLTAAKLMAETADVRRFHSSAAFAMHNGTAPIPVWSGNQQRHRLNRGGNRQLNVALHRIAITQIRLGGEAGAYVARRMSLGNSKTEAIRSLRRQLSDEVYRRIRLDRLERLAVPTTAAA